MVEAPYALRPVMPDRPSPAQRERGGGEGEPDQPAAEASIFFLFAST